MKIITIILTAFLTVPVFAQAQYEQGMKKAFTLYGEGKLDEAANMFERIGNAEQDKWLPYYYVAQININKSWTVKDENVLKAQLDKAQEFINMATTWFCRRIFTRRMSLLTGNAMVCNMPQKCLKFIVKPNN